MQGYEESRCEEFHVSVGKRRKAQTCLKSGGMVPTKKVKVLENELTHCIRS